VRVIQSLARFYPSVIDKDKRIALTSDLLEVMYTELLKLDPTGALYPECWHCHWALVLAYCAFLRPQDFLKVNDFRYSEEWMAVVRCLRLDRFAVNGELQGFTVPGVGISLIATLEFYKMKGINTECRAIFTENPKCRWKCPKTALSCIHKTHDIVNFICENPNTPMVTKPGSRTEPWVDQRFRETLRKYAHLTLPEWEASRLKGHSPRKGACRDAMDKIMTNATTMTELDICRFGSTEAISSGYGFYARDGNQ
jgi:hypothetical protein